MNMSYLLVFIGGGLGSLSRYIVSIISLKAFGGIIPIGTFISNLVSCVVLAVTIELLRRSGSDNPMLRSLILIGFCGGFSTFSTFSFETVQLIKNGNHLVAAGNVIVSVAVCLILIYKLTK
ncbi:MAG: fluoride efflux transporter CrcB [Flavobacteriales bacterium]|nr:fluoride efflux transporter CrcB [Flavobacteriales bacterium]